MEKLRKAAKILNQDSRFGSCTFRMQILKSAATPKCIYIEAGRPRNQISFPDSRKKLFYTTDQQQLWRLPSSTMDTELSFRVGKAGKGGRIDCDYFSLAFRLRTPGPMQLKPPQTPSWCGAYDLRTISRTARADAQNFSKVSKILLLINLALCEYYPIS
jgi:hypothetical protein